MYDKVRTYALLNGVIAATKCYKHLYFRLKQTSKAAEDNCSKNRSPSINTGFLYAADCLLLAFNLNKTARSLKLKDFSSGNASNQILRSETIAMQK